MIAHLQTNTLEFYPGALGDLSQLPLSWFVFCLWAIEGGSVAAA